MRGAVLAAAAAAVACCAVFAPAGCGAEGVWPQPAQQTASVDAVPLAAGFELRVKGAAAAASKTVAAAVVRYTAVLRAAGSFAPAGANASLRSLDITVDTADDTLVFGGDESYELTVVRDAGGGAGPTASLHAATPHGALRGLETFAQLADAHGPRGRAHLAVPASLAIKDAPRFAWRGLMIDTARHYYPVAFIQHVVDAMVASKLNVLHVHFTDDQSFPVESKVRVASRSIPLQWGVSSIPPAHLHVRPTWAPSTCR